ncbi:MAG: RagB/SusD family nutrient uptake outer membrane protein [Odoribacter sp.]
MKNLYIGITILLMAWSITSCQNFLDLTPESAVEQKDAMESVADCEKYLTGVYASFKNASSFGGGLLLGPDIQADMMLMVIGSNQTFASTHNWTFSSQSGLGGDVWSALYGTLLRANFLLEGVDKVQMILEDELTVAANKTLVEEKMAELVQIKAQAHLARALVRVELVKLFADPYDPTKAEKQLALPVWNSAKTGTPKRENMKEYYKSVMEDLQEAGKITNRKVDDIFFSKGAVVALQARVHFYMKNWPEAIKSATDLIEHYGYRLLDANDKNGSIHSEYALMWEKDKGEEIIWKVGFLQTDENLPSLGGIFCGLQGEQGLLTPEYVPAQWVLDLYQGDLRDSIFFQRKKTDYPHELTCQLLYKYPGNSELNIAKPRYANMPKVFRLSEFYLIRAEAYYQEGEEGKANMDLSALRAKRVRGFSGVTSYGGNTLYEEIKKERVRELYMEGHRLYDLKRYGQGFKRKKQAEIQPASYGIEIEAGNPRFVWPIPKHELDVPGSQMVGNPSNFI